VVMRQGIVSAVRAALRAQAPASSSRPAANAAQASHMEREPAAPRGYHPRRRGHPRIPPGTDHATWSVLLWQTRKAA